MAILTDINLNISASTVAWYGAIISTLSIILAILNYFRDKAKVLIKWRKDMELFNAIPPYKEKTKYIILDVINKGRRPIVIGNVGAYLKNGKGIILSDSLRAGYIKINEGEAKTYSLEQKLVDLKEIICFTASSQSGSTYHKRVTSWVDYLLFRCKKVFNKKY